MRKVVIFDFLRMSAYKYKLLLARLPPTSQRSYFHTHEGLQSEELEIIGRMKYCPVDPDLKLVKDLLNRETDPHVYRCISSPLFPSEILCTVHLKF